MIIERINAGLRLAYQVLCRYVSGMWLFTFEKLIHVIIAVGMGRLFGDNEAQIQLNSNPRADRNMIFYINRMTNWMLYLGE